MSKKGEQPNGDYISNDGVIKGTDDKFRKGNSGCLGTLVWHNRHSWHNFY